MVRGTSRRVIVVESPDTNLFEQAIFIVRNDALSKDGVTAQQLVDEACRVARSYTRSHSTRRPLLRCGSPVFWSAAGALGIAPKKGDVLKYAHAARGGKVCVIGGGAVRIKIDAEETLPVFLSAIAVSGGGRQGNFHTG